MSSWHELNVFDRLFHYRWGKWVLFILGWAALTLLFTPEAYLYFYLRQQPIDINRRRQRQRPQPPVARGGDYKIMRGQQVRDLVQRPRRNVGAVDAQEQDVGEIGTGMPRRVCRGG